MEVILLYCNNGNTRAETISKLTDSWSKENVLLFWYLNICFFLYKCQTFLFIPNSAIFLLYFNVPLNDLTFWLSAQLQQIPYCICICEPEASPSSLLARFPAEEIIIFAIQAAKINRDGGKNEPGSRQEEAFNWATSHQGEPRHSLVKWAQNEHGMQQHSAGHHQHFIIWKIILLLILTWTKCAPRRCHRSTDLLFPKFKLMLKDKAVVVIFIIKQMPQVDQKQQLSSPTNKFCQPCYSLLLCAGDLHCSAKQNH